MIAMGRSQSGGILSWHDCCFLATLVCQASICCFDEWLGNSSEMVPLSMPEPMMLTGVSFAGIQAVSEDDLHEEEPRYSRSRILRPLQVWLGTCVLLVRAGTLLKYFEARKSRLQRCGTQSPNPPSTTHRTLSLDHCASLPSRGKGSIMNTACWLLHTVVAAGIESSCGKRRGCYAGW